MTKSCIKEQIVRKERMFDMLNEGTAWYLKGLKNIMWRARFAKSTPFPNLIGHFGLRLHPHKTSKVE